MRWYDVVIDGRSTRVPAVKADGRLWFHWRGVTFVLERRGRSGRPRTASNRPGTGVLTSPMPGKITRVVPETGARVTKGQVLVVMEAMKMEYTLEADVTGTVAEICAAVGNHVGQGVTLIKVDPA